METMKIMKISTLLSVLTILVNCGGDTSSGINSVESLSEKASQAQVSARDFDDAMETRTPKMQLKLHQKSGNGACGEGGRYKFKIKEEDGGTVIIFKNYNCRYFDKDTKTIVEENGINRIHKDENGINVGVSYTEYIMYPDINQKEIINYFPSLSILFLTQNGVNLLGVNGEAQFITDGETIDEHYKYQMYFYVSTNTLVHIEGSEKIITPCTTISNFYEDDGDNFNVLTKHDSEPEYYKSGTIVINKIKYDYRDEDVILSQDGAETERVSQALLVEKKNSIFSSCSEEKQKYSYSYERANSLPLNKNSKNLKQLKEFKAHSSKIEIKK